MTVPTTTNTPLYITKINDPSDTHLRRLKQYLRSRRERYDEVTDFRTTFSSGYLKAKGEKLVFVTKLYGLLSSRMYKYLRAFRMHSMHGVVSRFPLRMIVIAVLAQRHEKKENACDSNRRFYSHIPSMYYSLLDYDEPFVFYCRFLTRNESAYHVSSFNASLRNGPSQMFLRHRIAVIGGHRRLAS